MGANGARIGAGQKGKGPIEGLSGEMEHQMANAAALIFTRPHRGGAGHASAKEKSASPCSARRAQALLRRPWGKSPLRLMARRRDRAEVAKCRAWSPAAPGDAEPRRRLRGLDRRLTAGTGPCRRGSWPRAQSDCPLLRSGQSAGLPKFPEGIPRTLHIGDGLAQRIEGGACRLRQQGIKGQGIRSLRQGLAEPFPPASLSCPSSMG